MKTKHLIILVIILLFPLYGNSITQNKLTIPTVEGGLGKDVTIPVSLTNDSGIVAAQFKLHFPTGCNVNATSASLSVRKDDHTLSVKNLGNNDYLFVIFSATNKALKSNSGVLLQLDLTIPQTWKLDSVYAMSFKQLILSASNGRNLATTSDAGAIKVTNDPRPDIMVQNITCAASTWKPGQKLTINWQVKNMGTKATEGEWGEQLIAEDANGNEAILGNASVQDALQAGATLNRQAEVTIPDYPGIDGTVRLKVKLLPSESLGELPGASGNNTTTSTGTFQLSKSLSLKISESALLETVKTPINCFLYRSGNRTTDQTFTLRCNQNNRISFPATLTIRAGESGAFFTIQSTDNAVLDADSTCILYAKNADYSEVADTLIIFDNELPKISVSVSKTTLAEGESATLLVERPVANSKSVVVNLSNNQSKRLNLTNSLTIPANQKSVSFSLMSVDDNLPALPTDAAIIASATGFATDTATFTLTDNDMPQLSLSFSPSSVSESAGAQASVVTVKRSSVTNNAITVKITDNAAGALFYSNATLSFVAGETEKQITLGVVDNAQMEGTRTFAVNASVYMASCGCSAESQGAGLVSANLNVLDDDGPALKITSTETMLPEGRTQATMLTITRNTPTALALAFNLSSDKESMLTYQHTASIPAGSASVTIPVDVKTNSTTEGNQTVTFTASASGFTNGVCWAMITDQTLPDATVAVLSATPSAVTVKATAQVELLIKNAGVSALASNTPVNIYLCNATALAASTTKQLLLTTYTIAQIAPNGNETSYVSVTLPDLTGNYYLIAVINEDKAVNELSTLNNTSNALSIEIEPSYTIELHSDKTKYKTGEQIVFSGKAVSNGSGSIAEVPVEIYMITNGFRHTVTATTDASGNFSLNYTPYQGQMGHFVAGACYPGQGLMEEKISFDIIGLRRTTNDYIKWDAELNTALTGEIELQNNGNSVLNNVRAVLSSSSSDWQLTFTPITNIAANSTAKLQYSIKGLTPSKTNNYEQIKFKVISNEGAELELTAYYYCRSLLAELKADMPSMQTSMCKGATRKFKVQLTNFGKSESGKITITLPNVTWMSLATPTEITNLAAGESTEIIFKLSPDDNMPVNVPVSGSIGINCEKGTGLSLPYYIETVSSQKGTLVVDVCDEYTYYTANAPHLAGANVTVRHPFTGVVIAEGKTDQNGLYTLADLQEGYYSIWVTADKHDSYQNNILVNPDKTTKTTVNLSFQAISYTWSVEETEIPDVYETKTVVKYETNVPVPVVEVKYPDELPLKNYVFNIYATNTGLVTANNVVVTIPEVEGIKFEFLTLNPIPELRPQQSTVVTVRMIITDESLTNYQSGIALIRSVNASKTLSSKMSTTFIPSKIKNSMGNVSSKCLNIDIKTDWYWYCGELKSAGTSTTYKYGECPSGFAIGTYYSPVTYGTGMPGPFLGYTGGVYFGTSTNTAPTVTQYKDCNDNCPDKKVKALGNCSMAAGSCIGGFSAGLNTMLCIYGAVDACPFNSEEAKSLQKLLDCSLSIGSCIPGKWGCFFGVLGCIRGILEPCDGYDEPQWWINLQAGMKKINAPKVAGAIMKIPDNIAAFQEKTYYTNMWYSAYESNIKEIFGNDCWMNVSMDEWNKFYITIKSYMNSNGIISLPIEFGEFKPSNISDADLNLFITRWNNSMRVENGQTIDDSNYINKSILNANSISMQNSKTKAVSFGYYSVGEMFKTEYEKIIKDLDRSSNSVCSSISLQLSQTIAMTRQAFKGTLKVLNGHETVAMKNVKLNMEVKDANGMVVASNIMEQHTKNLDKVTAIDGTGLINAKETGTAVIEFIPTKYAAPTIPQVYSFGGTLSYIDPFTNTEVVRNLYPIKMTVKPSPDLTLTYFMERDVLGDDPLTAPVEPMYPFEFSVLVKNIGAGDASKVHVVAKEPEVIKNEKGLLSVFELKESGLNGLKKSPNPNPEEIDFGTIPAGKTVFGQFWYTNTLLGHFVEYDTKLTHLTSFDNPDLSLISDVSIHELIRSVEAKTVTNETVTAFMTNDIPDNADLPDMLYLADGTTERVFATSSANSVKNSDNVYSLTITPSTTGYNYGSITDPTNGRAKLVSIKRTSDNATLSLRNFWQTDRTLIDKKEPVYEYKLHFVDKFTALAGTYVLTFEPKPLKMLEVQSYENAPAAVISSPVQSINVVFNKDIDASTFGVDDISLKCAGTTLDLVGKLSIIKILDSKYKLEISKLTSATGYYELTVHTKNITDLENYQGENGKSISWTQNPIDVQFTLQVNPANSGTLNHALGSKTSNFTEKVTLTATPATGYKFVNWTVNDSESYTENPKDFIADVAKKIIANFELINCKVEVKSDAICPVSGASSSVYKYNTVINLNATPAVNYKFTGWKVDDEIKNQKTIQITVNKDVVIEPKYNALGDITYKTKPTTQWGSNWQYTTDGTNWIDNDGEPEPNVKSVLITKELELPVGKTAQQSTLNVASTGKLDVKGALNTSQKIIVESDDNSTGQLLNVGSLSNSGQVVLRKNFKATNGWYYLSFPYDVSLSNIKITTSQQTATTSSYKTAVSPYKDIYIAEYNGDLRDKTGVAKSSDSPNWEAVTTGTLKAGKGYAIIVMTDQTFDFVSVAGETSPFAKTDKTQSVGVYNTNPLEEHRGWNFVGVPYSSSFDLDNLNQGRFYYIYDMNSRSFRTIEKGESFKISPFSAFFMQSGSEQLQFYNSGKTLKMPFKSRPIEDEELSLSIVSDQGEDKMKIRFNDLASVKYDIDYDAIKMESTGSKVPQIWSDYNNCNYSVLALPVKETNISVAVKVNEPGYYKLRLDKNSIVNLKNMYLFDKIENKAIDLSTDSEYRFYESAATNAQNRFVLSFSKNISTKQFFTELGNIKIRSVDKSLLIEGLIAPANVNIFNANGQLLYNYINVYNNQPLTFNSAKGVYLISINCANKKTTLKYSF